LAARKAESSTALFDTPLAIIHQQLVGDFVAAWNKVMNLDRFDLA